MTIVRRKPVKYLTNRELLAEINECKKTYCSFIEPQYGNFDAIVNSLDDVTDEFLEIACARRSKDLTPKGGPVVKVEPTGLIIRLMTYDHIPLDPDRKRKSRAANQTHAQTTFPPFKHLLLEIVDGEKVFTEVGRSHWVGGFENGWFDPNKGRVTERMGMMYYMLVERYSKRGNWRSYCVDEATEALTQRGWLKQTELSESDLILSYDGGSLAWSKIMSIYRGEYQGKMFHLTAMGLDALVTPQHKFVTTNGLKKVDYLLEKDRLILMGQAVRDTKDKLYSDDFVELVGWAVTEGSYCVSVDRNYTRVSIYQNEGDNAQRIRNCLTELEYSYEESKSRKCISFTLPKDACERICEVAPNRVLNASFLMNLTYEQRTMLLETMLDADGWRSKQRSTLKRGYTQKCDRHTDSFVMLCTLLGIRTTVKKRAIISFGKNTEVNQVTLFTPRRNVSIVENVDFHGGKRSGKIKGRGKAAHLNEPTIEYSGTVWCPETEFGSFIARRNGCVFLTGNSYLDEMKSLALMQLAQVGLQFDESKSSNPFSFYTTTVTNCFTRVWNLEKKNQMIRDDLLISMGSAPSHTRQIANELSRNGNIEPTVIPTRRGRKTAIQVKAEAAAEAERKNDE